MWLICSIVFLVIFCLVLYTSFIYKNKIESKFNKLISCFLQLDKNLRIEYESKDSIVLFGLNNRGSINISLSENFGLLYVLIEIQSIENYIEKKEWFFVNKMNEYLIFDAIINSLFLKNDSFVFSFKKVVQLIVKSSEKTKSIKFEPVFLNYNLAQSSFCLAFDSIQIIIQNKNSSSKSRCEILLFNCVICFQKINETKHHFEWEEYFNFLMQYIENQSLTKQIENLTFYFDDRISLYSEQIELIKNKSNPDYNLLYNCFFEKPLSTKNRSKHKEWDKNDFVKSIDDLIIELENKTTQLVLLSSQH